MICMRSSHGCNEVECVLESVKQFVAYLNNVKGQYINLSNHKY
jgi:hypothetical protein